MSLCPRPGPSEASGVTQEAASPDQAGQEAVSSGHLSVQPPSTSPAPAASPAWDPLPQHGRPPATPRQPPGSAVTTGAPGRSPLVPSSAPPNPLRGPARVAPVCPPPPRLPLGPQPDTRALGRAGLSLPRWRPHGPGRPSWDTRRSSCRPSGSGKNPRPWCEDWGRQAGSSVEPWGHRRFSHTCWALGAGLQAFLTLLFAPAPPGLTSSRPSRRSPPHPRGKDRSDPGGFPARPPPPPSLPLPLRGSSWVSPSFPLSLLLSPSLPFSVRLSGSAAPPPCRPSACRGAGDPALPSAWPRALAPAGDPRGGRDT